MRENIAKTVSQSINLCCVDEQDVVSWYIFSSMIQSLMDLPNNHFLFWYSLLGLYRYFIPVTVLNNLSKFVAYSTLEVLQSFGILPRRHVKQRLRQNSIFQRYKKKTGGVFVKWVRTSQLSIKTGTRHGPFNIYIYGNRLLWDKVVIVWSTIHAGKLILEVKTVLINMISYRWVHVPYRKVVIDPDLRTI